MSKRGNGEGTIYFSDKLNKWVAQCYINDKRRSFYGKTRKEVNEKMQNAKIKEANNTFVEKTSVTLNDIIMKQLNNKFDNNLITERTYKRSLETIGTIKKHGNILDKPIQKISINMLQDFFKNLTKFSNSTISQIYQIIKRAFLYAFNEQIVESNPFFSEDLLKPKSKKQTKVVEALTIDEEKKLINVLLNEEYDSMYRNVLLLMLFTGIRIGEALAIHKEDIDFKNNDLFIHRTITRDKDDKIILANKTKTSDKNIKANRHLIIDSQVEMILKSQLSDNELLFCRNGNIIDPTSVNDYNYKLNKKYNIAKKLHNHIYRHTYATRKIEGGMSAKVLQKKLGHAKISTTLDTYASVFDKFEISEDEKCFKYEKENGLIISGLH